MCWNLFKKKTEKPIEYVVHEMSWEDLVKLLGDNGLELMLKPKFKPDYNVYFTDEAGWSKIIPYLTYSAEVYVEWERRDCDDYSKKASADAGFNYGLFCAQAWGNCRYGVHAFNLVVTSPTTFKLFEPNAIFDEVAGRLIEQGEESWQAKNWK
ncbi:hypothetical protein KKH23_05965 [Patescibacteria group bacterium]|nr:hypothetical protein [Patescibacteria group bacterium]MBU0846718.1 hypothetical protein [Patescibacteria group bacterium]